MIDRFPNDVNTVLGLAPEVDMVALSNCSTSRGQQVLYKVVGQDDTTKSFRTIEKPGILEQSTSRKCQPYESVILDFSWSCNGK